MHVKVLGKIIISAYYVSVHDLLRSQEGVLSGESLIASF